MNYNKIYSQFIKDRRLKEQTLTGYTEKHHIIPRAKEGLDEESNLIKLTAEDHLHAHILLAKIYGGSMWYAISYIVNRPNLRGRIPTKLAIKATALARENMQPHSEQTRRKMSKSAMGRIVSASTRAKQSEIAKNRVITKERRKNMSNALKGLTRSIDTRRNNKNANLGKKLSPEHCKKMSHNQKGEKGNFYGKKHSSETRTKMIKARAYIVLWNKLLGVQENQHFCKKVKCTTTNETFKSYLEAADYFKIDRGTLRRLVECNKEHRLKKLRFTLC